MIIVNHMGKLICLKNQNIYTQCILGVWNFIKSLCLRIDHKVDGGMGFFIKHCGKTKFMVSMSKKAQVLGLEKLWEKGPKAFFYFFVFYLIRDTIIYIVIPIIFAQATSS